MADTKISVSKKDPVDEITIGPEVKAEVSLEKDGDLSRTELSQEERDRLQTLSSLKKIEKQTGELVTLTKTLVKVSPALLKRQTTSVDIQALPAAQKGERPALIKAEKTSPPRALPPRDEKERFVKMSPPSDSISEKKPLARIEKQLQTEKKPFTRGEEKTAAPIRAEASPQPAKKAKSIPPAAEKPTKVDQPFADRQAISPEPEKPTSADRKAAPGKPVKAQKEPAAPIRDKPKSPTQEPRAEAAKTEKPEAQRQRRDKAPAEPVPAERRDSQGRLRDEGGRFIKGEGESKDSKSERKREEDKKKKDEKTFLERLTYAVQHPLETLTKANKASEDSDVADEAGSATLGTAYEIGKELYEASQDEGVQKVVGLAMSLKKKKKKGDEEQTEEEPTQAEKRESKPQDKLQTAPDRPQKEPQATAAKIQGQPAQKTTAPGVKPDKTDSPRVASENVKKERSRATKTAPVERKRAEESPRKEREISPPAAKSRQAISRRSTTRADKSIAREPGQKPEKTSPEKTAAPIRAAKSRQAIARRSTPQADKTTKEPVATKSSLAERQKIVAREPGQKSEKSSLGKTAAPIRAEKSKPAAKKASKSVREQTKKEGVVPAVLGVEKAVEESDQRAEKLHKEAERAADKRHKEEVAAVQAAGEDGDMDFVSMFKKGGIKGLLGGGLKMLGKGGLYGAVAAGVVGLGAAIGKTISSTQKEIIQKHYDSKKSPEQKQKEAAQTKVQAEKTAREKVKIEKAEQMASWLRAEPDKPAPIKETEARRQADLLRPSGDKAKATKTTVEKGQDKPGSPGATPLEDKPKKTGIWSIFGVQNKSRPSVEKPAPAEPQPKVAATKEPLPDPEPAPAPVGLDSPPAGIEAARTKTEFTPSPLRRSKQKKVFQAGAAAPTGSKIAQGKRRTPGSPDAGKLLALTREMLRELKKISRQGQTSGQPSPFHDPHLKEIISEADEKFRLWG